MEDETKQPEQTQEEPHGTDWKAEARKWEERSKQNLAAAREAQERAKEATDALTKATEAEARAKAAEDALAALRESNERDATVRRIAAEQGVSADVLARMGGDVAENAALLKASVPAYRDVRQGGTPASSGPSRESILAIKNQRERLRAIQENIELFK